MIVWILFGLLGLSIIVGVIIAIMENSGFGGI